MKKILCGVLSLVVGFSMLSNMAYATTENTAYLEMDLSEGKTSFDKQSALITQKNVTFGTTDDKVNYTLFDKTAQQYLKLESNPFTKANTTIGMWVNLETTDANERALFNVGTNPSNYTYQATVANGKLTVALKNKTSESESKQSVDLPTGYAGAWTYFAFVETVSENNVTVKAYINPSSQTATPVLTVGPFEMSADDYSNAYIGATGALKNPNKDSGLNGKIAALGIYQKAFTAAEAFAVYDKGIVPKKEEEEKPNPNPGPTVPDPGTPDVPDTPIQGGDLVYDLEVGEDLAHSYDKFQTQKALNYNTAGNAPIVGKFRGVGNDFNYISFNDPYGTENRVKRAPLNIDTTNVPSSDALTFETWVRLGASGADGGTDQFCFLSVKAVKPDQQKQDILQVMTFRNYSLIAKGLGSKWKNGENEVSTIGGNAATVGSGEWRHVVITKANTQTDTTLKVWVDGDVKVNQTLELKDRQTVESSYQISICGWPNGQNGEVCADVADFKVYTKQLSDSEVSEKFNEEKGKYATPEYYYDSDSKLSVADTSVSLKLTNADNTDISKLAVTDADGNPFGATITKENGNLLLNFSQYLRYGLKLKIANIVTNGYNFVEVDGGSSSATAVKSGENAVVTIKNTSSPKQYKYAVIQRRANGAAVSATQGTVEVTGTSDPINVAIAQGAEKIYVYVWEVSAGNLIPVQSTPIILE